MVLWGIGFVVPVFLVYFVLLSVTQRARRRLHESGDMRPLRRAGRCGLTVAIGGFVVALWFSMSSGIFWWVVAIVICAPLGAVSWGLMASARATRVGLEG